MLPTPEQIQQTESKSRPLVIEPWVAAYLSRVWKDMKQNIQESIAAGSLVRPRNDQSEPASAHNHS